jgi:O-Antigen ligase
VSVHDDDIGGVEAGEIAATSGLERVFLFTTIVALPTENHFTFLPGFSLIFLLFGAIALYVVFFRFSELLQTVCHPLFLAAFLFLGYGVLMELTHDNASYGELFRVAQMIVGAVLLATICRDWPALRSACHGYLIAGVFLSALLFFTSYGALSQATTANFQEASELRASAFENNPLEANLNSMAFGAGQAAVVALAWALAAHGSLHRNLYLIAGVICMIGSFLPLSRGGVAITIAACASVMYAFGLRHGKPLLIAVLVGGAVLMWVPQSVWSRMSFSFEEREGKVEGRARVYGTAIDHLPEYVLTGIGAGNFWSAWGLKTELNTGGRVTGSHNCFIQVTLYWGILGLLALVLIFWQAYRCIPRYSNRDAAALSLVGVAVSLGLYSMVIHSVYAKEFSLGLGLLAGGQRWIWPQGIVVRPLSNAQSPSGFEQPSRFGATDTGLRTLRL